MAKDVTLLIKLNDQASGKIGKITNSTKRLEKAANGAQNSIRRTNKGIRDTGRAADNASKGVNKLGKAVRGLAAGFGVFQAGKFVIFKTAELERQTKSLEVLTGSLGNARTIIKELQQFGAVTPFTSSELIETAKRLKAFGFQTKEVVDVTKRLADVAGATGADLGGIATAFGQIQAKGRLQGEELLQLQERGVSLQDELQKMYGLTADEFRKALEGGRISADAVNLALQNITETGGKYAGGAIAQSDTLAGKFSTLVDGIETISRNIGEVLSPALKGVLGLAVDVVNSINAVFNAQKRLSGFGISDEERDKLFRQADKEALQIAKLRAGRGGTIDSGEFTRIRAQRFSDLINQFAFDTGQLIPEVSAPQTKTKLPELLTRTNTGKTPAEIAAEAADKQRAAVAKLLVQKKQEAELIAATTDQEREQLQLKFDKLNLAAQFPALSEKELQALRDQLDVNFGLTLQDKERIEAAKLLKQQQDKQLAQYKEMANVIENGIKGAIMGAIDGSKSLGESLSGILRQLGGMFLSRGIGSFKNQDGTGGSGLLGLLPGFAGGGRPPVGRPSIVGERGPELFVPSRAGTIIPNHELGGSTSVVVNVDASGTEVQGNQGNADQLGRLIGQAVQAELIKQKRPGGLLTR